ncbi:hypothetical protein DDB_G0282345 [Dictyostelium discoideum AX4]|uniref:Uncharacterized protein n=1 Tax=Dictyostelium discoideum TaxID=44689 RepID=Q54SM9_DICDI|nr:hypothetical protein DDB_G0282345 [Dictyostelium discoideum AX4]EAL66294.1 hypothetical protein DDB_G0282345 [Dictyostelium discoideum AX4]|eukprot:XP_640272.1 hypothetical protein DDB_G0282345 [Dictyostelium discoideum AX4]
MYTQKDNSSTQQEIANLFGISRSAISRSLNSGGVAINFNIYM